jgi:hypothetical protein
LTMNVEQAWNSGEPLEVNVADILRKKFEADTIQCYIEESSIKCFGEVNPNPERSMQPYWEVEVDSVNLRGITGVYLHKFRPMSRDMLTVVPAGNTKMCMVEHGNGVGTSEIICSEQPNELERRWSNWGRDQELIDKGFLFKRYERKM